MSLRISQNGIDLIKHFEGLRLNAYLCPAGVYTIGYGHTKGVKKGDKLKNKYEAEQLLREDLKRFEAGVLQAVNVHLKQNQFDALVSFAFNVGLGAFKRSTLLKKLNQAKYFLASLEFLRWNKANVNGKYVELAGLTKRRTAEKVLFNEPDVHVPTFLSFVESFDWRGPEQIPTDDIVEQVKQDFEDEN